MNCNSLSSKSTDNIEQSSTDNNKDLKQKTKQTTEKQYKLLCNNIVSFMIKNERGAIKEYIKEIDPDIIMLQEINMNNNELPKARKILHDYGFTNSYFTLLKCDRKRYGTLIALKGFDDCVIEELDFYKYTYEEEDDKKLSYFTVKNQTTINTFDGRLTGVKINNLVLICIYATNSGAALKTLDTKIQFFEHLDELLKEYESNDIIIAGDFNVALNSNYLKYPKQNMGKAGYNELEIKGMQQIIKNNNLLSMGKNDYTYTYYDQRQKYKTDTPSATWLIDYIFTNNESIYESSVYKVLSNKYYSDHFPMVVEFKYKL
jgi:exodeoxyribonuclease III